MSSRYCIDSNVLIEAKNGPYGFDIVPAFWSWLDDQAAHGRIYAPVTVLDELIEFGDELSGWARDRRASGLFVNPSNLVQAKFSDIATHVEENYPDYRSEEFLGGADPWVVAHAVVDQSVAVTKEVLVPDNSTRVKIPNVCRQFGAAYADTYQMMRGLGAKFG